MKDLMFSTPVGGLRQVGADEIHEIGLDCYVKGEEGYPEARAIWNGTIETEPAAVVCPANTAEVEKIVRFAGDKGLSISVKGGGHNVSGSALIPDGLTVSLSRMRTIEVDPENRTVRMEGGVTLGELDAATQAHGLAVPSGFVSKTGMAGLSLRGGLGHLMRRFGLSCDNLLEAEIVTSDGIRRRAAEEENPDLLWALKGGGVNLGVVTSFLFRLHEFGPEVNLIMPVYPAEKGREVIEFMDSFMRNAPKDLGLIGFYGFLPEEGDFPEAVWNEEVFILFGCYSGPRELSDLVTGPLRSLDGLLADLSEILPYTELQQVLDGDYPDGMRYYWRSLYLDELTDEMLAKIHEYGTRRPSPESTLDLWNLGGAVDEVDPEATAFRQRGARYMLAVEANWSSPEDDDAAKRWARGVTEDLGSYTSRGSYLNFAGTREEGKAALSATYGANLDKLRELKNRYDPDNLFG